MRATTVLAFVVGALVGYFAALWMVVADMENRPSEYRRFVENIERDVYDREAQ